ncbi:unnamed protein product [Gadus morhua 'NCC']
MNTEWDSSAALHVLVDIGFIGIAQRHSIHCAQSVPMVLSKKALADRSSALPVQSVSQDIGFIGIAQRQPIHCAQGLGLKVKRSCTSTSDAVCEVLDGFFCSDSNGDVNLWD